ncbi:hypothetical protein JAAARDRAFT_58180 [Jaapia argillacea MUCL 33604]|uniref:DUF747-domain-containing protein n=1 Tax=Jaapia argillacea MUCL 33604 TaxID=933084 RepID=A0A067Q279_9AGAM|nr:hypothetical protein JAAARDRAFT_58180 [Jaapia argillacea MUCL 33604]
MAPGASRRRLGRRFSASSTVSAKTRQHVESATLPRPRLDGQGRQSLADLFVRMDDEGDLFVRTDDEGDWVHDDHAPRDPAPRFTYASLPPTPISRSPPPEPPPDAQPSSLSPSPSQSQSPPNGPPPFSLWDYLREELLATDFDEHQEMKWDRVSNFLSIPLAVEKIIQFGFILCLDSFLYTFTIQPIRFILAFYRLISNSLASLFTSRRSIPPSQKADILRMLLLVVSLVILVPLTDASKIYHSIRGQDTIKLYVIFNALEIADRLLCSIGQDILDCLFSRPTLDPLASKSRSKSASRAFKPVWFFIMAVAYVVAHTLILTYQTISLNVAVNAYDHALLTLLVSNQFVEIKGSVFKKFEKDNLFQITCADIVERFTLSLMLFIVAFRNLIELSGSSFDWTSAISGESVVLPKSFLLPKRLASLGLSIHKVWGLSFGFSLGDDWGLGWLKGGVIWTISYPVLAVLLSETLVDWLKHAFITKFNHIRPSVYERYTDVLCGDLRGGWVRGRKHSYVDQSPLVARRLGFPTLPLANLAIIIGTQSIVLLFSMQSDIASGSSSGSSSPSTSSAAGGLGVGGSEWDVLRDVEWVRWVKWGALGVLFWLCFVVIKIIMGVNLVSYASRRQSGVRMREEADVVNDWGRDPIGEGEEERKYNRELKKYLVNPLDDASPTAEIGEYRPPPSIKGDEGAKKGEDEVGKKKKLKLEDITRFTMVKRIW